MHVCKLFSVIVCMFEGGGVSLSPSCFSLNPPLGQLTQQIFSWKEDLVQFGPLYGNVEQIPSGFIKIIQNDFAQVLNLRYICIAIDSRDYRESGPCSVDVENS